MKNIYVLCALLFLTGCHGLKTLTPSDVRQKQHYYKTVKINKSIKDIEYDIYQHNMVCTKLPDFIVDPKDRRRGVMILGAPGPSDVSVIVLFDFREDRPEFTEVDIYTYYDWWRSYAEKMLSYVERPRTC